MDTDGWTDGDGDCAAPEPMMVTMPMVMVIM
jgi:hypothetical protein